MGIDVWTLRSNAPGGQQADALPAAADSTSDLTVQVAPKTNSAGRPAATQRQVNVADVAVKTGAGEGATEQEKPAVASRQPRFTLAFLHYGKVGLCISLPDRRAKVPRLFCDDIARALGNDPETARFQLLEWPMLSSSTIDQSITAAIPVVAQKFSLLPTTVLVFGEDVKQYHPGLDALVSAGPAQEIAGQTVYLFDEVTKVMQSANSKRALWQKLRHILTATKTG